ncbi:hypothetical protein COO91_00623 [Nostoc flagelliforme CCNUN1]|uniref:Uncharacterized protein n=1 Tax=Nostoc flagelliforme CCNUN1 TaxID=2038116 RepID=A0A2K8SH57_9NOSO|nr:hypothetical protein COO91_00623 [Nostoc flagelliforme CCNUN1]
MPLQHGLFTISLAISVGLFAQRLQELPTLQEQTFCPLPSA